MVIRQFDVFLIGLDPTIGAEMQKTRPCLVISPNEMNAHLLTVIVAPLTTQCHGYPMRVSCRFNRKQVEIVLDQLRAVDKRRLIKRLGRISVSVQAQVRATLIEMFA